MRAARSLTRSRDASRHATAAVQSRRARLAAALELSGFDVEITLEQVRSFDKSEQTLEGFWGYLEGRGWAFLRDENYNRIPIAKLPKVFVLSAFRNDVYRSMGGFARVFDVLKRGKELDDRLFFEFRCARSLSRLLDE
jgi:hypothetical protein